MVEEKEGVTKTELVSEEQIEVVVIEQPTEELSIQGEQLERKLENLEELRCTIQTSLNEFSINMLEMQLQYEHSLGQDPENGEKSESLGLSDMEEEVVTAKMEELPPPEKIVLVDNREQFEQIFPDSNIDFLDSSFESVASSQGTTRTDSTMESETEIMNIQELFEQGENIEVQVSKLTAHIATLKQKILAKEKLIQKGEQLDVDLTVGNVQLELMNAQTQLSNVHLKSDIHSLREELRKTKAIWNQVLDSGGDDSGYETEESDVVHIGCVNITANSLHVPVNMYGQNLVALVDTGSEITVLNSKVWKHMSEHDKPYLEPFKKKLMAANNTVIKNMGCAKMEAEFVQPVFDIQVVVGDIGSTDFILGMDMLSEMNCTIQCGEQPSIKWFYEIIQEALERDDTGRQVNFKTKNAFRNRRTKTKGEATRIGKTQVRKVSVETEEKVSQYRMYVAKDTIVGPREERLVEVQFYSDENISENCIIEPLPQFSNQETLLVARTIWSPGKKRSVKLRIINAGLGEYPLYRGTQVATLEPEIGSIVIVQEATPEPEQDQVYLYKVNVSSTEEEVEEEPPPWKLVDVLPEALPGPLYEVWERDSTNLNEVEKLDLAKLLFYYQDVFVLDGRTPAGSCDILYHNIYTGDEVPVKQRPRRVPHDKIPVVQENIDIMLKDDVIEPSISPWASPIVLVTKKDGTIRFCIDYRKLNERTKKDAYPLPRIDDALEALSGAAAFCTLDLFSAYHQLLVDPEDRPKTAFSPGCGLGLYQFKSMPFGLTNAPATFERLMELVLVGLQWQTCLVYLDDVLVFGPTNPAILDRLAEVMERLRWARLKLKPTKCEFFQKEVPYLGFIVSNEGIKPDPKKIETVKNALVPQEETEVRSFLGLASFYRRFVKGFSQIAAPMNKLLERDRKFAWTEDCQEALDTLKSRLTEAPILACPNYVLEEGQTEIQFILDVDASSLGMGGVLMQEQEGEEKVIAYASKRLDKTQRGYCTTKREMLAVVTFLEHYRPMIMGYKVKVRSDHNCLHWYMNFKNPEGQWARFLERIAPFKLTIEFRPGKKSGNADALSRWMFRPGICKQCKKEDCPDHVIGASIQRIDLIEEDNTEFIEFQKRDPVFSELRNWLEQGKRPHKEKLHAFPLEVQHFWMCYSHLVLKDGLLYYKWMQVDGSEQLLLMVPRKLIATVLNQMHNAPEAGHFGRDKTYNKIKDRFYWFHVRKDVFRWCHQCRECSKRRTPTPRKRAPMTPIKVNNPDDLVCMDILTLPQSESKYQLVLVMIDHFTKWIEVAPLKNQTAKTVAQAFVDYWISRNGVPRRIHTDQGTNFESALMQELYKNFGALKSRTTAYHPQSDGISERMVKTLKECLSKYVDKTQRDWPKYLQLFAMAYRTSVHATTRVTPAEAHLGRNLNLPIDLIYPTPRRLGEEDPEMEAETFSQELEKQLEVIYELIRQHIPSAQKRQKKYYDQKIAGKPYKVGDRVWITNEAVKKGMSKKMSPKYLGPFVITKRLSDAVYRVKHESGNKFIILHFDRLKPCDSPVEDQEFLSPVGSEEETSDVETEVEPVSIIPEHGSDKVVDEDEYEIDKVIRGRYIKGKLFYLCQWKGYSARDRTYEPLENLSPYTRQFLREHPVPIVGCRKGTKRGKRGGTRVEENEILLPEHPLEEQTQTIDIEEQPEDNGAGTPPSRRKSPRLLLKGEEDTQRNEEMECHSVSKTVSFSPLRKRIKYCAEDPPSTISKQKLEVKGESSSENKPTLLTPKKTPDNPEGLEDKKEIAVNALISSNLFNNHELVEQKQRLVHIEALLERMEYLVMENFSPEQFLFSDWVWRQLFNMGILINILGDDLQLNLGLYSCEESILELQQLQQELNHLEDSMEEPNFEWFRFRMLQQTETIIQNLELQREVQQSQAECITKKGVIHTQLKGKIQLLRKELNSIRIPMKSELSELQVSNIAFITKVQLTPVPRFHAPIMGVEGEKLQLEELRQCLASARGLESMFVGKEFTKEEIGVILLQVCKDLESISSLGNQELQRLRKMAISKTIDLMGWIIHPKVN